MTTKEYSMCLNDYYREMQDQDILDEDDYINMYDHYREMQDQDILDEDDYFNMYDQVTADHLEEYFKELEKEQKEEQKEKQNTTEIVVSQMQFLDSGRAQEASAGAYQQNDNVTSPSHTNVPQQQSTKSLQPPSINDDFIEDDIPF